MAFTKNDEAVSPVIGVILMVAITVILAAVIAAFVFGMAGNIQKSHNVAATVSQINATGIVVTYQGGADAASVTGINISVNGVSPAVPMESYVVGSQKVFNTGTTGKDTVVVTAYFEDGTTQVILDTTV